MKLWIMFLMIGVFAYVWYTKIPTIQITEEFCKKYAFANVERVQISTLKFRDQESQQILYEDCVENNKETPGLKMLYRLLTISIESGNQEPVN